MNEELIARLEDMGRVREILHLGIWEGSILNCVVKDSESFVKNWSNNMTDLFERIETMEKALEDAFAVANKWEESE